VPFSVRKVAGVRLAVREWGAADGVPIVFWHALGPVTTGEYAAELAGPLVARGAHVVAPDGPGHGASPKLPRSGYRTRALAQVLDALLDDLGAERAVLVGHSWGAMVVAHFAAARPERVSAVVLLDAGYGDPRDQPGVEPLTYEQRLEEGRAAGGSWRWADLDAFDADARDGLRRWTPELRDVFHAGLREDSGEVVARVSPEARAAIQDELYRVSITSTWPALWQLPVLLLAATEPPELEPYREEALARFRAALPAADVRRMEGAGHDLVADLGPDLGELIADWLGRRGVL
jgi:pimeloyl-ACP methyl ester carboxylesterase